MSTVPAPDSVLATSASVRAGMSTALLVSSSGLQSISRTASRNRSVAARVSREPSISSRMPVSIGSVSSRPAATATCCTAWASTSPWTTPATWGIAGSSG